MKEKLVTIYYQKEISSAHRLKLPYKSKCKRTHGHNYLIEVWITGSINEHGMVMDYNHIKEIIDELDHRMLNRFIQQPTAENIVLYLIERLKEIAEENVKKIKVRVWEDSRSYAESEEELQ